MATTVLLHSEISPPPQDATTTAENFTLPIVFFDMLWYEFPANQSLLFFEFPSCSKSHFLDTIIPNLKHSLSLTLSHFLPLAGKIIHPLTPTENKPVLRYKSGDAVSFTVSESGADFDQLTGNYPRVCDDFYAFAPNLPPAIHSDDSINCPVLALQVTLFPGKGLCIGFITHHAVADASTVVSFIQAWAIINKSITFTPDDICARILEENNCLPFYDRKNVANLNGLDSIYWDLIVKFSSPVVPPPVKFPINKLRATFVLKNDEMQKLKKLVIDKCSDITHLSSFTVICALFWVCTAKSASLSRENVADDEPEYFGFVADCRGRLKPPLPANYFGNCVALVKAELKHGEVKGPDGFFVAARVIGRAIKENVYNENGILCGAENWPEEYGKLIGKRQYGVAGSPRFDFYKADFGWGKANKFEALFIDDGAVLSLCKSRDFEGGFEIGLSKTVVQMDAFCGVFREILNDLLFL